MSAQRAERRTGAEPHKDWHELPRNTLRERKFFRRIGKPELEGIITDETPFAYYSMEYYDRLNGIKGGGGLGVLAGDTRRVAQQLDVPMVVVTPFYPYENHQEIHEFWQDERWDPVDPETEGFNRTGTVSIATSVHNNIELQVHEKQLGSTRLITVTEPNYAALYAENNSSDKRLYQEVALGFGGEKVLKEQGLTPAVRQLNEAPTVFAAIAHLDDLCQQGMNIEEALSEVRKHTLYTNHTLVQAVEGVFSAGQFEHFVLPNVQDPQVSEWLRRQSNYGAYRLSDLALQLADHRNGVSELHARVAKFADPRTGQPAIFDAVTNGISLPTWVEPRLLEYYRQAGVLDEFDLPTSNYREVIHGLDINALRALKKAGRVEMNKVLRERKDQYGNPVEIEEDAIVYDLKRRIADYKRNTMPFRDPEQLAAILKEQNAHFILSGKAHPDDLWMKEQLAEMLRLVDRHPELRQRVHFIQDYDEEVGRALALGADVALNIPRVGQEACGTSWMKDIANLKLLLSTNDGGVADLQPPVCLEVRGNNEEEELASLYEHMRRAGRIMSDHNVWESAVKAQLSAYMPTISGSRMIGQYMDLLYPFPIYVGKHEKGSQVRADQVFPQVQL